MKTIITFLKEEPILCYVINISTSVPFNNYDIYIDAKSSNIISVTSSILHSNGTAETYYHYTKPRQTHFNGEAYKIKDNTINHNQKTEI